MRSTRLITLRESGRRIGTVGLGAAAVLGLLTAPAHAASWSGSLTGVIPGYESRRWYDTGGSTTIKFTGCSTDGSTSVTNVTLRKDTFGPDPYYVRASFTQCHASSTSTSTGTWSDHGAGDYYFVVNDGATGVRTWVKSLTVSY
ncbi:MULTISPECIES: hypothetical protein [Streptomyces]|uniref:hypothetical protein n=2 Tax=Streptomyces TaxID=1883 RepID=UPI00068BCC42|nr:MULTISPECIES: hypothetical protein [Streptomyces]